MRASARSEWNRTMVLVLGLCRSGEGGKVRGEAVTSQLLVRVVEDML